MKNCILVIVMVGIISFLGFAEQVKGESNVWTQLGPNGIEVRSLAISPNWAGDQTLVFGSFYMPGEFYRTTDGGTTWWSTKPLGNDSYYNHFDAIALSPDYQHDGLDQTVFLGGGNSAGVYLSRDSGETWSRNTAPGTTWDFAVSPAFATDGTVFVAGNSGVHKSVDGGVSFVPVNNGLPSGSHLALAISPNYYNTPDHTIFVGTYYGVYKSTDGADTWAYASSGLSASETSSYPSVNDMVISPNYAEDHTIFAGVYTRGIYRSTDGGANWSLVYPHAYVIRSHSLAISPNYANDRTIFVGTTFHYGTWTGVVVSRDSGDNWSQMDNTGFSSIAVQSSPNVVVSPDFPVDNRIFVGTRDGVWTTTFITNTQPVANAGPDQSVNVGGTVTLDGSTSWDPDGNPLTFSWAFTSTPSGSTATLDNPASVNPSFNADVAGTYIVSLTVNDGNVDSAVDTVTISTINVAPIADAGDDQSVNVGGTVTLDGSGSSDPDGNPLTFSWAFTSAPAGSMAALDNPASVNPSFTADVAGTYIVSLTVNDGTVDSAADTVTISTINVAPIADAGDDQSVNVGGTVTLDGSTSWDPDGNPLTFSWAFTSTPSGSTATLDNPASVNPSFTADVAGTYIVSLTVNDGTVDSAVDTVTISTINVAPIADAGDDQSVNVGGTVTLDGSTSWDPDGNPLTFSWAFTSTPSGSTATLDNPASVNPSFTADVAGTYIVSLTVNDGTVNSDAGKVTISAVTQQTEAISKVQDGIIAINEIAPETFNNPNNKKTLTSKLNTVIEKLENGEFQDAQKKLENDILSKIDGCALTGSPDKNDWINDCDAQALIYPLVVDVIELLKQQLM